MEWVAVEESLLGLGVCGVGAPSDLSVGVGGLPADGIVAVREQTMPKDGGQIVIARRRHVVGLTRQGGSDAPHDLVQRHGVVSKGVVTLLGSGNYEHGSRAGGDGVRQGAHGLLDICRGQVALLSARHPLH